MAQATESRSGGTMHQQVGSILAIKGDCAPPASFPTVITQFSSDVPAAKSRRKSSLAVSR
jgi:hypothetical protein